MDNPEIIPEQTTIVLPGRRAGAFLKNELKTQTNYKGFAPEILSIEDFIAKIAGLQMLDSTSTLFAFYKTYVSLTPEKERENFETFYSWALHLINDFNEIDRYLIDAQNFFGYLGEIKNIEHWSLATPQTELVKNYIGFWDKLSDYYNHFIQELLKNQTAFQGLMYRQAAAKISDFLEDYPNQIIFVGFNALNNAEQEIINKVLETKKGEILWDIDRVFLDDPMNEAGLFIRKYLKNQPESTEISFVSDTYSDFKNIHIIGVPKNVGQAKILGEILKEISTENAAVVINDESLLSPVLNSLPPEIEEVNITMGLPLEQTPPASFFEILFKLAVEKNNTYYYKNVLEVLNHPTLNFKGDQTVYELQRDIIKNNKVFISAEEILKYTEGKNKEILQLCFVHHHKDIFGFLDTLLNLTDLLRPDNPADSPLEAEYLFHFNRLFKKLHNLLKKFNPLDSIEGLHRIYSDLLNTESVDFSGSPFTGLQIMGMLETRVLDYDTVIMTSVNEGVLPSGKSTGSFIPYDLKKQYGLPTYKEKDAVYAYHFYRLLQRAKNVYLLYNAESSGLNAGEKSRFLYQMEVEKPEAHSLHQHLISPDSKSAPITPAVIEKTPEIMTVLKKIAAGGFSPSALTTYIRNPMDFYRNYILGIKDTDEVEETISALTLGNVVHNTLENFYKPLEGNHLTPEDLKKMKAKTIEEVNHQFKEIYSSLPIKEGKNLIIYEVAKKFVFNFLQYEAELINANSLKILHIESADLKQEISVPGLDFPVFIKGRVDRVDELNGNIRVIDYKTGVTEQKNLNVPEWKDITENEEKNKAFQVLCYAYMLNRLKNYNPIYAGIISFRNLGAGFMSFGLGKGKNTVREIDSNLLDSFQEELIRLIAEIFDADTPFIEKEI